jgi:hypothetical protein
MFIFDPEISKVFCQKYIEFIRKKHKVTDLYDVIAKELNKRSILNFPIIKRLAFHLQENKTPRLILENLDAKQRHIVYLFAIYYGYIWFDKVEYIWCRSEYGNLGGNDFCPMDIHEVYKRHNPTWNEKSGVFDYRSLKRIKMYTPELFRKEGNICYLLDPYDIKIPYIHPGIVKTCKTIKLIKL